MPPWYFYHGGFVLRIHQYLRDSHGHHSETTAREIGALYGELTGREVAVTPRTLARWVAQPNVCLFVVCDEQDSGAHTVVGTASLIIYETLRIVGGKIDDVVVAAASRGRGIGRALLELLIGEAHRRGIDRLELTSRPDRTSAHTLYQSLGFERRETNVYRLTLPA